MTLNPTHEVLPWAWATRALAAYREGENVAALDWAGRSLKADAAMPVWYRAALAHSIVAMAQHRLKHPEAARQALSLAAGLLQPVTDRYDRAGQVDSEWHDWLIADLLLREAREAIASAAPIPESGRAP